MTIQLKIKIRGISTTPVWRRILIPGNFTFEELHDAIQAVFGWSNEHLYQFQQEAYGPGWLITDLECNGHCHLGVPLDAAETEVGEFLKAKRLKSFVYLYDFVNDWIHDITVERISEGADSDTWCRLEGSGDCPPEDCGGASRYEDMRGVMCETPDSEEAECVTLEESMSWLPLHTLMELAGIMGFETDWENDEERLLHELATHILSHPRELLCVLPVYDLMLLNRQLKEPTSGHLQEIYKDIHENIIEEYGLAVGRRGEDGRVFMHYPADLLLAVGPYMDEVVNDKEEIARMDLEIIVAGICNLYGRVSRAAMKQMLVSVHVCKDTENADHTLEELVRRSLLMQRITSCDDSGHAADDEVFYASRYEWEFVDEFVAEVSKHNDVTPEYRQPGSLDDLRLAGSQPIPQIPNAYADAFNAFLHEQLQMNEWDARHVCHLLWYLAQHQGEEERRTPAEFMMAVMEELEQELDPEVYAEGMHQMDNYLNHMPRWQLRGHTAAETGVLLSDIGSKTSQVYEALRRHFHSEADSSELENALDWLAPSKPFVAEKKPGRNDPCPCGSGKKYKKCCGRGN